MHQMVLTGIRQMEERTVADPVIRAANEVLIRLATIGVCGSDVHYYVTGRIGSQVVQYPYAVGHECAGTVASVGSAVTRVRSGDRVAIDPAVACGTCDQCRAGRENTCRNLVFLGCPGQIGGCLGESLVMPESCCFPIPDSMSLEAAAASEPLAIGVYAVKRSVPMAGARIGIHGFGPIGMSVLLPALAYGAEKVYVSEPLAYRRTIASTCGATWTGDPAGDLVGDIQTAEPLGLDAVFECCGQQSAVDQAIRLLKPGGRLMLIGIPPELDAWRLPTDICRRHEITVVNVRRQCGCVQETLDLLADGRVDVGPMITHRFGLDGAKTAFDLVEGYADGVMKAMIRL